MGCCRGSSSLLEHIFLTFQNFTRISFFMNLWWVFLIRNHAEWEYYLISHLKAVKRIRRYRRFDISGIIKNRQILLPEKICMYIYFRERYLFKRSMLYAFINQFGTNVQFMFDCFKSPNDCFLCSTHDIPLFFTNTAFVYIFIIVLNLSDSKGISNIYLLCCMN